MNDALIVLGLAAVFMLGIAWYDFTHRAVERKPKEGPTHETEKIVR